MSRPLLLVFVLLVLIMTSQFEWRQPFLSDTENNSSESDKQKQVSNGEDGVKEKIILSQEKNIQRLNELVRSLREEVQQCQSNNETSNQTLSLLTQNIIALEQQQILED